MDGDGDGVDAVSVVAFVERPQHALVRLAYLLAGDRGHAEDLVRTALMTTYRSWDRIVRRGEPSADVRRAPGTTHTSRRRRARHRQPPSGLAHGPARVRHALSGGPVRTAGAGPPRRPPRTVR